MRLSEEELAQRGPRIQQLLRPISPWHPGPAWERVPIGMSSLIIGTHDGARPTGDYRDWRFRITAKRHQAMYFELWRSETLDRYVLDKAYLNIYKRTQDTEKEILCLHCDPSLPHHADHVRYKRGPHIHMSIAGSPYGRAHIALWGPKLAAVLRTTDALHDALAWGIQMIRDEVIVLMREDD